MPLHGARRRRRRPPTEDRPTGRRAGPEFQRRAAGDAGRPDNADWTIPQGWDTYTAAEHAVWRTLFERQTALLPGLACDAFIQALPSLGARDHIPRFEDINTRLRAATGWEIVAVPGLIPEQAFFQLLADRRFPVTDWIRTPEEFDYIVEPDVFHDLFGHVPLLFDPVFADYVQRYGQGGLRAHQLGAGELLSRLYWYTIEFGLVQQRDGLEVLAAAMVVGHPLATGARVVAVQHARHGVDPQAVHAPALHPVQRAAGQKAADTQRDAGRPAPGGAIAHPGGAGAARSAVPPGEGA